MADSPIEMTGDQAPDEAQSVAIGADGSFTLDVPAGVWALWFRAPEHSGAFAPLWLRGKEKQVRVEVRLPRLKQPANPGVPFVRGEWTKFKTAESMMEQADGGWSFERKSDKPEEKYFLQRLEDHGPVRFPNPSEPGVSFEEGWEFRSLAKTTDGSLRIHFNPIDRHDEPNPPTFEVKFPGAPREYSGLLDLWVRHHNALKAFIAQAPKKGQKFEDTPVSGAMTTRWRSSPRSYRPRARDTCIRCTRTR